MDRVRADMREAGLGPVRGPFGPTQNDECGLQVEGFGERPYFLMPYNPPSHVGIYEELGLQGVRDMLAYRLESGHLEKFDARMSGLAARIRKRFGITARTVDRTRIAEECALVTRLFNESLADEWNFMPLSYETALGFVRELLDYLEPDAMMIAEAEGRPIGLSIALPDANELLADARRFPRWLRWPRLAWLLKTRRCSQVRWAVFAMLPEYRKRGATALLVFDAITRMKRHYSTVGELSWTQDINHDVNRVAVELGLEPYKRYRIYQTAV